MTDIPPPRYKIVERKGRIIVTDSHPRAVALADDYLQVTSTAALLAEHLTSNR